MKIITGNVYKNKDGEFLTPAQSGNFYICDMWVCDKNGNVPDIEENPCPVPKMTSDLVFVGKSTGNNEYPDFNPKFF